MLAKLVLPDGQVRELTDEQYAEVEKTLAQFDFDRADRLERKARLKQLLEEIRNEPEEYSKEWWDEFEKFLAENRFKLRDEELNFDDL